MDAYMIVKILHILSATGLFGARAIFALLVAKPL
tara:strand:- start:200 stop:301 length:102 start_codon:yes stop_codon:yes gene_type:complete